MTTFNIIRGHKLILWASRLKFKPEFTEQLDKFGTHYVQDIEQVDTNSFTLIVLAKMREQRLPLPIIFTCTGEQVSSLVEKVQTEGELN